ncbi:MAG: glycoside hydrolase family 5 protein, partial [Planctomycetes bacterium]|nr:glycoside hydrolase family 5 protein [Planctomycetota bacterium]
MRLLPLISAFLLGYSVLLLPCALAQTAQRGDIIFETNFEGPDALKGWGGSAKLAPGFQSSQALFVERAVGAPGTSAVAQIPLPVEKVRGCLLHFSGMVRAENVSEKPQSWNGVKFMAPIVAEGGRQWPQGSIGVGTFDWQRVVFPVRVPTDATQMSLYLGLEAVTGKVWYDDIKVTVRKPPFVPQPRTVAGPPYKGHNLPRLRGAMVSPNVTEDSLRLFGQDWKANLIRWQLVRSRAQAKAAPLDLNAYDGWLEGELRKLDAALPLCEKYGLLVVVDLHSPPGGQVTQGGYAGSDHGLFTSAACQRKFIEVWQRMAQRYKSAKAVWGYDLANEPIEGAVTDDVSDWQELAERTAKAIREIDPQHAILVEPPQGGGPGGFTGFNPIDVPGVVYSVHMYLPHSFTHQGVHGPSKPYAYPGEIDGKLWDKARLELALKPVVEFQKRCGVHIYVGEFSAIRWAPDNSAYRYLKDLIDIFEANGWDWSYHAFREWSGWSVEHGD